MKGEHIRFRQAKKEVWVGKDPAGLRWCSTSGYADIGQRREEQNTGEMHVAVSCRRSETVEEQLDPIRRPLRKPAHALIKAIFVTVDIQYKGQMIKYFKR